MTWVYIWLFILVLALVIEFVSFELVSVWVAFGALVSIVLAFCKVRYEIQIVVAVVVSVLCLIFLRKLAMKYFMKNKGKTNMDVFMGQRTRLLKEITEDEYGTVRFNDVLWTAKSKDGQPINNGEWVEILEVQGNKLIVKKVNKEEKEK